MSASLDLTVKRMARLDGAGATKAFCDVAIAGAYLIKGLTVVNGKKGIFVNMPREQGKDGRWYDTVLPMTKEAREHLSQVVLEAYGVEEPALE